MKEHKLSLHLFRRDLRLQDNTALQYALNASEKAIPAFILDERQITANPYRSDPALAFMIASLSGLDSELKECASSL